MKTRHWLLVIVALHVVRGVAGVMAESRGVELNQLLIQRYDLVRQNQALSIRIAQLNSVEHLSEVSENWHQPKSVLWAK